MVTRWYRAPEVCLEAVDYTRAIDIWSLGCILGEMFLRETVMKGQSDADQINQIFRVCGTPDAALWARWRRRLKGAVLFPERMTHVAGTLRQQFATYAFLCVIHFYECLIIDAGRCPRPCSCWRAC